MQIAIIKITDADATVLEAKTITAGMVGATVAIEYSPEWDTLDKRVAFRCGGKTINAVGNTVPHELLECSGLKLQVGVYGCNEDGSVQIPTIWASLGTVQPGADPEGDEAAKPTLPVFARLEKQMQELSEKVDGLVIPEVDATLSKSGAAADAKAVGDKITALEGSTIPKETTEIILPEQTMTFADGATAFPGCIAYQASAPIGLQEGETCIVSVDGAEYQCPVRAEKVVDPMDGTYQYLWVGNGSFAGLGADTGEPFLVGDIFLEEHWRMGGVALAYQGDTPPAEKTHTIGVTQRGLTLNRYYTKAEIDAVLGSYINDIDALLGIDDSVLEGGGA